MTGEKTEPSAYPAGYRLGAFEVLKALGSGAFADVYLARNTVLDNEVALKVVRGTESEETERQGARFMCRLRHPNIVSVLFADRIEGRLVIAMEFVHGSTLRQLLTKRRRLGLAESLEIAHSVARALEYVHGQVFDGEQGLAHLDLKPSNILIDMQGVVRIADFGMARVVGASGNTRRTGGSPAYMAPEQFEGRPILESDLWAVGVLLYEMILGQAPFQGGSLEEYRRLIGLYDPDADPRLVPIPVPVREIVARCLQKDAARRFPSAQELASALVSVAQDRQPAKCDRCGTPFPPGADLCPECTYAEDRRPAAVPPQPRHRQPGARPRLVAGFAILLALSGLSWGGYLTWEHIRPLWTASRALNEASQPDLDLVRREQVLKSALAKLKGDPAAVKLEQQLQQIERAKRSWAEVRSLESSKRGTYQERVETFRNFALQNPGTAEAREALRKADVWEKESRLFRETDNLEKNKEAPMSAVMAKWVEFRRRQTTGFRRAYAESRIESWKRKIDEYAGYAQLTVRSAAGLPPMDVGIFGRGQPDPYFVVLEGKSVIYRSRVLRDTPTPEWNETVRVMLRPGFDLALEIRDDDLIGYDLLFRHQLDHLPPDGSFQLAAGSIHVALEVRRDK